jgi:glycosyltransferase involved in cell wall biosynthesis
MDSSSPGVTLVVPCLNEEQNIKYVLQAVEKMQSTLTQLPLRFVVADNGSSDGSKEICRAGKVQTIDITKRGYGACLAGAIEQSDSDWIAYFDADGTYHADFLPTMIEVALATEADMVIASRFRGKIHKNAMPFAHRYFGTPMFNAIIYFLFGKKISDCNSGMRLIKRKSFITWNVNNTGMEFATAMIAKAIKHNAKIEEVSIDFFPPPVDRKPHLKPIKDGLRHLISLVKIRFFEKHAH